MTAIAFRFLAGRYHATPWERHPNEGSVEWPPSPWRVLRALVAASYRLQPQVGRGELRGLLELLARPPVYRVPPGSIAHTRHYMPTDDKPTLVFDTFVAVGNGAGDDAAELIVAWPDVQLHLSQQALLDRLLDQLSYLGRSESWVEARRTQWNGESNVQPDDRGAPATERVRVKALSSPEAYQTWRSSALQRPRKGVALPETTLDVLEQDNRSLQRQGWSEPPGTEWLVYRRPDDLLRVRSIPKRADGAKVLTFARYAIRSAVPPLLTDTILVGEQLRVALISHADRQGASALRILSGHDADGRPLSGNRHAYFLPVDEDSDGRIDHLIVWARGGFDSGATLALTSIRQLRGHDRHPLHLALIGFGTQDDYASTAGAPPSVRSASIWESRTPFILPRHPKVRRGLLQDSPEQQLRALLAEFGLGPAKIEPIDGTAIEGRRLEWFRFRRERKSGKGSKASSRGFGFRLHFKEPVRGPIAVGYGAHVGLGQFIAGE